MKAMRGQLSVDVWFWLAGRESNERSLENVDLYDEEAGA